MGAPAGNKNATKNKPFADAIRKAIAQGDPERLERIAKKLLDLAEAGDLQAVKELADRTDGKPKQTIGGDGDAPLQMLIGWKSS